MINLIKSSWSLGLIAVLAAVGAIVAVAQAQEAEAPAEPAPDFTYTVQFGQYYHGLLDYTDDGWCGSDREVANITTSGLYAVGEIGLSFTLTRSDPDGLRNIYGSPIFASAITQKFQVTCESDEDGVPNTHPYRTVRISVTGDEALVPQHAREVIGGGYVHDLPHPTHVAEIDALETRVAEAEARSFVQATQLVETESTVTTQGNSLATVTSRVNTFLQPTVTANATRIVEVDLIAKESRTTASGNRTSIGTLIDRVTALESE